MNIIKDIFTYSFFDAIVRMATPLVMASLAAYIAASTGIGNIAVEGVMCFAALFAILGSYWTQSAILGLLIGLTMGIVTALIIAFFSMKLGATATMVGIALNTFADSLATFFLYIFANSKGSSSALKTPTLGKIDIPFIKDIPVLGQLISGKYVLTYVAVIVIIITYILLFKTPLGMRMRACGLNADAAKTAGISVSKLQLFSLILSGFFAAIGGTFMSINYLRIYSAGMTSGFGWMGIAANGVCNGSFSMLMIIASVFAVFRAFSVSFMTNPNFPTELIGAIPYFAVFVILTVLAISSYRRKKKGLIKE